MGGGAMTCLRTCSYDNAGTGGRTGEEGWEERE